MAASSSFPASLLHCSVLRALSSWLDRKPVRSRENNVDTRACHAATATQSSNSKLKNKQLETQAEAACMHHNIPRCILVYF